jgi:branched-chain amino acid transport system ATP-binding protein
LTFSELSDPKLDKIHHPDLIRASALRGFTSLSIETHLKIENMSLGFGNLIALQNVSLELGKGEILGVIGPNGAGKTCLLNCVSGFYKPQSGHVFYKEKDLLKIPTHTISHLGISRTFQNVELYTGLSSLDNLLAARHNLIQYGLLPSLFHFGRSSYEEVKHRRAIEDIIKLLEIEDIRDHIVGSLPYGLRKRVELGRALVQEPEILLLDEPMAGMNVEEKEDMARFILDINELKGTSVMLIEHDMGVVMDITQRIVVLDFGNKIAEGTPQEIRENPAVINAYLGKA